ncbi:MAG: hypothetical protein ACJ8FS_06395 [Sphingomicrobium sp.]
MPEAAPVTVYLDTQDYSRFGDVIRGQSSDEFERVFEQLKSLRDRGRARFVYSAAVVSELLQYDSEYEDTCIAKAKAIEQLCAGQVVLFPSRLVERQAADFAATQGILSIAPSWEWVRNGNEWFPRVSSELESFKDNLRQRMDDTIQQFGSLPRSVRRRLKGQGTDRVIIQAARAAVPEIASKYQLPEIAVESSIILLLKGRISADEASLRLFGAIARPTAFVHVYFKTYEGDRTAIPLWLRAAGETLQASFVQFRDQVRPLLTEEAHVKYLREVIAGDISRLGLVLLRLIDTDEAENGVTSSVLEAISAHPNAATDIPCCNLMSVILLGYIEQTVAVLGQGAKIERSFGGDLIHALYVDCVDIWRGDRRFSELLRQKLPSCRSKLQPSLLDLPDQIEKLWRERVAASLAMASA